MSRLDFRYTQLSDSFSSPTSPLIPPSNLLKMKRYAIVGLGGRSSFFYSALAKDFKSTSLIVGLCDTNQTRMNVANDQLKEVRQIVPSNYRHSGVDEL